MFAEQAFELIKELERNPENLPPFNVRKLPKHFSMKVVPFCKYLQFSDGFI